MASGDDHTAVRLRGDCDAPAVGERFQNMVRAVPLDDMGLVVDLSDVVVMGARMVGLIIRGCEMPGA